MLGRELACNVASWAAAILWTGAAVMMMALALAGTIYFCNRLMSRGRPPQATPS